jgi:hypothetical protein
MKKNSMRSLLQQEFSEHRYVYAGPSGQNENEKLFIGPAWKEAGFPASEIHLQQAVKKYNGIDAKKVTCPWRFPDGEKPYQSGSGIISPEETCLQ